jgi:signal peptidase I
VKRPSPSSRRLFALGFLGCALFLFAVSRWVLVPYRIVGGSMRPTLLGREQNDPAARGDVVLVNRLAYLRRGPERWDIIVVDQTPRGEPPDHQAAGRVKRVVGLPGETISIRGGKVLANGLALEFPAHLRETHVVEKGQYGHESLQLGSDEYFLLGDSSYLSRDSRHWGAVSRQAIGGKVMGIIYPWGRSGPVE